MSNQAYLNSIKQGAIQGWHTHKILPSLTGAQAALESGWGSSKLSKPPYNNNFGIKAGDDWTGRTVTMSTQEWVGGRYITINDSFRAYDSLSDSVKDHAAFFTNTPWRTQNYRNVVGERDYKRVAQAVSSAGYATDPSYVSKIIRIIEENNLYNWDQEAFNGNVANSGPTQENTNKEKTVGKDISTAAKTTTEDYTITVIGDSLGVGTEPFLKQLKWSKANYDNYGSRQWTHSTKIYSAIDILTDLASAGSLNNNVIFILGTNRGVDASEIDTAVGIIGRDRNIILVDTASEVNHRNTVSNRYKEASKRHENVFYANWSDKARPNIASWYYADGAGGTRIHMNSTGYKKHADFIVQAIYEANATSWEKEINTPTQKSEENIDIYNIEYDDGKYTSPKGDSSIYNAELNQQYGFKPRKGEIMWVERIYEGNEDNPSDLLQGALDFMEEHSVPGAQYTVNMRYLPEDIAIGDTGIFIDHEFNPPLYIEARVLEINTSVSNPESDSVVLGNVIEVHPKDKSDILSIQKELQKTREDLQTEFWKEKPVNLEMLTSNGLHLSTDNYIPKNELNRYKYDHVKVENGTGIVHLTAPRDPENNFTFYGHIADNYIDAVDELVDEIINIDGEEIIFDEPIDPNTNPQGPDVLDPNDLGEIRELKVKEFDVEFLDILGRKIGEDTIQVYEDSTFSYKVSGYTQSINKINILSTSSFTLDVVSFKEDDDYKSPFADKTRLYVKAIQEDEDVTYKFKNFIWTRVSDNQRSDEEWNDINKWNETSGINLTASDIEGNESTFICRMYDDDFNFVNAIGATVKIALEGKSAYEQAVENGYEGTEEEWIDSLRGSDGVNGIPGEPGEDGQSTYIHVAWADSPMGDGFSTSDSTDKEYMGTYVDEIEADSDNYLDYEWMKVKGEKGEPGEQGPRGLRGLEGPQGKQGIEGKKGIDGKSSYTHIAYATGDQGQTFNHETFPQATHIGMYVSDNQNSSDNWKDYKWTLIKGANGARGLEGPKGKDGRTPYFHTAWANSADGKSGFSTTVSAGKLYLGTATTFEQDDPTDYTKYSWTLIKGEKGDKGDTGKQGPRGVEGAQGPQGDQGIEGKKGADGKPSYTHIAYADTITGTGFSHSDASKPFIGIYADDSSTSSETASKYTWSKWHGEDGDDGVQGPKGVDGKPSYTHFAYANNATGTSGFSTSDSLNKTYLGIYTDNTKTDSKDPGKYNWTLIKGATGAQGPRGVQGLQGPQGKQGIKGDTGANGKSSYTHIAYATGNQGQSFNHSTFDEATYVGMYVSDNQDSSGNWRDYEWTLIKGRDGSQGVRGPQGPNGKTPYFHIAYANNSTGTSGFSINDSANKLYIGTYTDFESDDSDDPKKYNWTLVKGAKGDKGDRGPQGPQGIKGPAGSNGQSQWVHIRYSANSNGSGMDTKPSSTTKYVGIAVTNSATAPGYTGFTWSKYIGENGSNGARGPQGVPGKNGANGTTTYTWVKYADDKNGGGMNDYPEGKRFIGLAFNKTTQTESTTASHYQWSEMPQNIEIGGRNLLRNSDKKVSNGTYNIARYDLTDKIKEGEEVTLTIWGSLAATKSNFRAYNSGGSVSVATLTDNGNGTYSSTFKWKVGSSTNTYLNVYAFTNSQTGTSKINKIKLERGNIATDWTEAPEDTQAQIDEKANNSDLDETVRTIETESRKIASLRTDVDITKNNFLITHTDEYVNKITTTKSSLDGLDKRVVSVEETKENIDTFFQFDEAFTIGKSNAQTKLRMTNDEIQFLDGETKGTYITGNTMVSQNIQIQDKLNLPKHTMETEGDVTVIRFTG